MTSQRIILAGIDEAGYGPLLGPLCVGLSVFSLPGVSPHGIASEAGLTEKNARHAATLNLWERLSTSVTRERPRAKDAGNGDALGRVAIADSKELKLAGDSKAAHPLVHLERGVLAMLAHAREQRQGASETPADDAALLAALGATMPAQPWYALSPRIALPQAITPAQRAIAANILGNALRKSDVQLEMLRCHVIDEASFNALASKGGKAATTWFAVSRALRLLFEEYGECSPAAQERASVSDAVDEAGSDAHAASSRDARSGRLSVTCDRLGGRVNYATPLQELFPSATITVLEESDTRSRYIVEQNSRRMGVSFLVEGEKQHLPIALASMVAKLTRELLMQRFNAWWCAKARESAKAQANEMPQEQAPPQARATKQATEPGSKATREAAEEQAIEQRRAQTQQPAQPISPLEASGNDAGSIATGRPGDGSISADGIAAQTLEHSHVARKVTTTQPEFNPAELKPTAGYASDALRWLRDAQPMLTAAERETLVRIA